MAKSNQQINKEMAGGSTQETTLAVVDYRMGQLESAVKEGFAAHDKKLDGLTANFASKDDIISINRRLDNWVWYWRAIISAVLIALATACAAIVAKK